MNSPLTHAPARHHPMMIVAAIAIILFCLAGTAAIMGWIPSSISGNNGTRGDLSESDRLALASQMQTPSQAPLQVQQLAAEPVRQPVQQYAPEPAYVPREPAPKPVQLAAAAPVRNQCTNCGNIESIREIKTRAEGSGVGAAGGAILGGLLGNQVGGGSGRQIATVAGAVGGAVVGNQVEGNMKATTSYQIQVRMDNGRTRTFTQQRAPAWRSGDRVRVVKGALRSVN